jgi:uncharacterized membrane protein YjgN (DUF898 family)
MDVIPSLNCAQCGSVRSGEPTCSHCGAVHPASHSLTAIDPHTSLQNQFSAPPHSQGSNDLSSLADECSNSAVLISGTENSIGASVSIPPAEQLDEPFDSALSPIHHPIFWGRGRTLFGIFIINTFFTLLTLGLYSFWGRVRIRQYLSSQTSFAKIRFSYHGTPQELLKGWSKAFAVFGLPYAILSFLPVLWDPIPGWMANGLAGMMALCFIPVAVVGSHRYRMSRTSLGTIRFSFRGRVTDYMKIWISGIILTVLTVGIYYPYFENAKRAFLVRHSYFGNRLFTYDGTGSGLLQIYTKAAGITMLIVAGLIGISAGPDVVTTMTRWPPQEWPSFFPSIFLPGLLALLFPWFYLQAAKQRYQWNHTDLGDAHFHFSASTWNVMELRLTNLLMLILTFGLAWPWVQVRNLQFLYYHLSLQGPLDFQRIQQEALDASPTGEELAGYFDAGFDLG